MIALHHIVVGLGLVALVPGCVDEASPPDHLYGRYALTRTLEHYWEDRTDVGFAVEVSIALQREQVVVSSDQPREAIVLRHRDDLAWFELYETGWSLAGSDVTRAVVGYELEETEPGRVTGRAGASLQNEAGAVRAAFGFDVVGERIAPD